MASTVFTIRMDSETKRKFDSLVNSFGLTANAAFNMFAAQVVREERIPFEVGKSETMSLSEAASILNRTGAELSPEEINEEIRSYREGK